MVRVYIIPGDMRKHLSCCPIAVDRDYPSKTIGLKAVIGDGETHKMITGGVRTSGRSE